VDARGGGKNVIWGHMAEVVAASAPPVPLPELKFSTQWDPLEVRSTNRPLNPADLLARGCRCGATYYGFVELVMRGCPCGVLRFKADMPKNIAEFRASLRHDMMFELLSRARAHPINRSCVFRGLIDPKDADTFRVAACLENVETGDYYATFKHHLAFVLRTEELLHGIRDRAAAADLWTKGVLLFIFSAPRSYGGRWRITLATPSPIRGDCVLVVLGWAGNNFFGDEALRRGTLNTVVAPPPEGNVLRGIITYDTIQAYVAAAAVPLDQEQLGVLARLNTSSNTLLGITALAGVGKTVLAHCVIKAFVAAYGTASPRRLMIYTVPTRALREEVVMDLLKFKACFVSCFPISNSLACPALFLVVYINNVSRLSLKRSSCGLGGRLIPRSSRALTSKSPARCVLASMKPTRSWKTSSSRCRSF